MALSPDTPPAREDKLAVRQAAERDVLLREVDEAVRREQMEGAARRYGLIVGAVVLAALIAFGAWLLWRDRMETQAERRSEQLVTAFDEIDGGALAQADAELAPLATGEGDAAAVSAALARAAIALRDDRADEAAAIYEAVAAQESAPQPYRDLATIRWAAARFDEVPAEAIVERLRPLAVPGGAWFGSAGELLAMAYLKQGRTDLAGPLLAAIARDDDVPETLRSRTRQLAGLLGVDAVEDDAAGDDAAGVAAPAPPRGSAPASAAPPVAPE